MKKIATVGDKNPIEHGGGVIFDGEAGPFLEWTKGLQDTGPGILFVFRRHVPENVFEDLSWVNKETLAHGMGGDPEEMLLMSTSEDPFARAMLISIVGDYFGWHELDDEPMTMTDEELAQRWFPEESN